MKKNIPCYPAFFLFYTFSVFLMRSFLILSNKKYENIKILKITVHEIFIRGNISLSLMFKNKKDKIR